MGNVVNQPDHGALDWVKVCENSSKVITFIDLAGHLARDCLDTADCGYRGGGSVCYRLVQS